MTKRTRIILELLGPAALGATLLVAGWIGVLLWDVFVGGRPQAGEWVIMIWMYFVALACAYVLVGLQSIAYTIVMEWRYSRGLEPTSWKAVRLSAVLGAISGLAPILVKEVSAPGNNTQELIAFAVSGAGMGLAVGWLLGMLIKWRTARGQRRELVSCT